MQPGAATPTADLTLVRAMPPPADLAPLVEEFAERRVSSQPMLLPVFPTGRVEILFHFGDPFLAADRRAGPFAALPRAVVLQARAEPSWQAAGSRIDWFLVKLTPLGCRTLLGAPQARLWDEDIALDAFWGATAAELWNGLVEAPDFQTRVALATAQLRVLALAARGGRKSTFAAAADRRRLARAASPGEIAALLDVGERRLRQGFRAEVGRSPKTLLRLVRFGRYLAELHPAAGPAEEPHDHGYFDDSHAIREFRRLADMTPGAYRRAKATGDRLVFTGPPEPRPATLPRFHLVEAPRRATLFGGRY